MRAAETVQLRRASAWDLQRLAVALRRHTLTWSTLAVAGVLCFITFVAGGGLSADGQDLGPITAVEIVLTLGGGVIIAGSILLTVRDRPVFGGWSIGLLMAFAALCALSVVWSVSPDASWQNADQILAYSAFFATAVMLARAAPSHWPAVLGGIALAAVIICGYALATKVFPAQLDVGDPYARLRAPYDYWNALGLNAALGVICCLWLGTRRSGHPLFNALAYPGMAVTMITLLLAYSRGSLAVLLLGLLLWLCMVPLRLRSALLLIVAAAGAAVVVAWDFSQHALTTENVPLHERVAAGRQLGVLLVAIVIALLVVGLAICFVNSRRAPPVWLRRRIGAALLSAVVVVILAFIGALAASHRGLFGTISHDVSTITNPNAPTPPNTPGRLTAIASVRARYWKEALEIFQAHPIVGTGARTYGVARLRYRKDDLAVMDAHGFIVQTLSDLGLLGLAVVLALLAVWLATAGRVTHPFNRRWSKWRWRSEPLPYPPERIGMLAMLCVVVVFGLHSFVDWTWFIPGDACVALLCAGWLAGRGPLNLRPLATSGATVHDSNNSQWSPQPSESPQARRSSRYVQYLQTLQSLSTQSRQAPESPASRQIPESPTSRQVPESPASRQAPESPASRQIPESPTSQHAPESPSSRQAPESRRPTRYVQYLWFLQSTSETAMLSSKQGRGGTVERWMDSVVRWLGDVGPARTGTAIAVMVAALLAAWTQWQPLLCAESQQEALLELESHPKQALANAQDAIDRDPLSAEALFTLASIQSDTDHPHAALATLQQAVRLQPSNPQTWLRLGEYELKRDPTMALKDLQAVVYLNPQSISATALASRNEESIEIYNYYVEALRAATRAT